MADGIDLYDQYVEEGRDGLCDALDTRAGLAPAALAGSLCALAMDCLQHRKDERIGLTAVMRQLHDLVA
jgi:hypothetical protein